ncbi:hypothetical protein [Acetomicrobium mobile]|jgi:hypothetical protein|uniref:hypothetical protein n=1 Tax=Acetomicrobium mobile TaxID=97477 RepID=UPI0026EB0CA4|nr:hypothetical protein [Acetomicrobium mobile]
MLRSESVIMIHELRAKEVGKRFLQGKGDRFYALKAIQEERLALRGKQELVHDEGIYGLEEVRHG